MTKYILTHPGRKVKRKKKVIYDIDGYGEQNKTHRRATRNHAEGVYIINPQKIHADA